MVRHGTASGRTADFHAHHSPVGALASFTIGRFWASSGPGCEIGRAAPGGAVCAGYRDAGGPLRLLPFFPASGDERERYVQGAGGGTARRPFTEAEIEREVGWCTDRWTAGALELAVFTPLDELPDPATAGREAQRAAFRPAVLLRMTVANPGTVAREAVFAVSIDDRWLAVPGMNALRSRHGTGIATDHPRAAAFTNFSPEGELDRTHVQPVFGLGGCAGFRVTVQPGSSETLTIAIGWWKEGTVTIGRDTSYWYTTLFSGLGDVLQDALAHASRTARACAARDAELASAAIDDEQRFIIAHATRGYHASTQLLNDGGVPRWVVNEGEYLMLNTFDLTVDMAFHELRFHPWSLADVLDQFAREYRYESRVYHPSRPEQLLTGGVAFTHDMGVMNVWSPDGRSSYEIDGLDRACFSHMSCEELCNWVLCAGLYWAKTGDRAFIARHAELIAACQTSLLNRDHPDAAQRRGWMQCEDERCRGGGEITTYDSLDHSLGQSRANAYLAVKMWASHLALEALLTALGRPQVAAASRSAATMGATAVAAAADAETGLIPALLDGSGTRAPIIPVIEGLAYPWHMGLRQACAEDGPYGVLVAALRRHLAAALVEGVCLYPDGGWKLSASADNSWASKIHLCQHVAEDILGVRQDPSALIRAHRAHADWQRIGAADHAVSDQFRSGKPIGSLYYPRIVTALLWLEKAGKAATA